ncbi:MAG: hypothetical protein AAFN50_05310 [Pseudomonadota bacterium]
MLSYFDDLSRRARLTPAVLAAALSACATETVLLNSERIEQRFGSYGIEVLASEAGLRRSSLYSLEDDTRVCRTYAIVRFSEDPDTSIGTEHARVLAGNSLGEVFKSNGWRIHKQTMHIGSFDIGAGGSAIANLMHLEQDSTLAVHVYQLLLARGGRIFEYATIIEAHHPDYLDEPQLLDIYAYDKTETLQDTALQELHALLMEDAPR